jgi:predicted metal-dependent hydrolase
MPSRDFQLSDDLSVTIVKRRSSRHLRLRLTPDGQAVVSIPSWAPYKVGLEFARSRQSWIIQNLRQPSILANNQAIGKAHHLVFEAATSQPNITSRVKQTSVVIRYPVGLSPHDPKVQHVAKEASVRALRTQAENLLPQRLSDLARRNNFSYRRLDIKRLKGRWGSCDQRQNIVLNLFLMQLPWHLIDYVLVHELAHTVVLGHGKNFWQTMEVVLPESKQLRRQLRGYQPQLNSLPTD